MLPFSSLFYYRFRYSSFLLFFFFFKQKTAYEMRISDWSSDVCSSDLLRSRHALLQDDEQESGGWRGDRVEVAVEGDRDRAEEGRGAQLRHSQAGRRI